MCLGIPGKILKITDEANLMATVAVAGVNREISIAFIVDHHHTPAQCIGEWVLIHVGFAMTRLDEQQAAEMLITLLELDEQG